MNGMLSCVRKLRIIVTGSAAAVQARRRGVSSGGNQLARKYTINAPTVMPNIAMEIATNAKW